MVCPHTRFPLWIKTSFGYELIVFHARGFDRTSTLHSHMKVITFTFIHSGTAVAHTLQLYTYMYRSCKQC